MFTLRLSKTPKVMHFLIKMSLHNTFNLFIYTMAFKIGKKKINKLKVMSDDL